MKIKSIYIALISASLVLAGCSKDFLQKIPQGQLSEVQVADSDGIEATLLGAYGIMNGNVSGTWGNYASAPSQWLFGEVASDNAHKGSEATDQPNMNLIESLRPNPANDNLSAMWEVYYEGVLRCNITMKLLRKIRKLVRRSLQSVRSRSKLRLACFGLIITFLCGEYLETSLG